MKIVRSATRIVARTNYAAADFTIDTLTAERIESMCPVAADTLGLIAALVQTQHLRAHRRIRTVPEVTLHWAGLSVGRDYFTVALHGPDGLLSSEEINVLTFPGIGARDRERLALARAHRAAGIALSLGGAQ